MGSSATGFTKALLKISPALVHFSGHGDQDGQILLENAIGYPEPITAEALADLFRTFSRSVRSVVLNACDSAEQATTRSIDRLRHRNGRLHKRWCRNSVCN